MQNSNQKQTAFAVFALLVEGKIKNIAFSRIEAEKSEAYIALTQSHQRIGTVHATDLFVRVHKGFAGSKRPEGIFYAVHEQSRALPPEAPGMRMMVRIKKSDWAIARDASGNAICDPESKKPMLVSKSSIVFAQLVPNEEKEKVKELLEDHMAMPCTLYSFDSNISFTLYTGEDKKLFVRPGKYFGKTINVKAETEPAETPIAEMADNTPF